MLLSFIFIFIRNKRAISESRLLLFLNPYKYNRIENIYSLCKYIIYIYHVYSVNNSALRRGLAGQGLSDIF